MGIWTIAMVGVLVGCEAEDLDPDGDGLTTDEELALGTDPNVADTDGDTLSDFDEVRVHMTDPLLPDTDGDGLRDALEISRWETDPLVADTDEDGLNDGDEVREYNTDPLVIDTDEDGYRDGDEVLEGSDPADPQSLIYRGGWPYNPNKNQINDPGGVVGRVSTGSIFPRAIGEDQFGQEVELYDFAAFDGLVVVDAADFNDEDNQALSGWLGGFEDNETLESSYGGIRAAVELGELRWLTFLTNGLLDRRPVPNNDVRAWADFFEDFRSPVLGDIKFQVLNAVNLTQTGELEWPYMAVLDGETMEVVFIGEQTATLDFVRTRL